VLERVVTLHPAVREELGAVSAEHDRPVCA
jgi:hypothetical protein